MLLHFSKKEVTAGHDVFSDSERCKRAWLTARFEDATLAQHKQQTLLLSLEGEKGEKKLIKRKHPQKLFTESNRCMCVRMKLKFTAALPFLLMQVSCDRHDQQAAPWKCYRRDAFTAQRQNGRAAEVTQDTLFHQTAAVFSKGNDSCFLNALCKNKSTTQQSFYNQDRKPVHQMKLIPAQCSFCFFF